MVSKGYADGINEACYIMDGKGNVLPTQQVVLQMLVDDIKQLKQGQRDAHSEFHEEFNRLNDKMDGLRSEMNDNLRVHDRDIVRLEENAKMAGKVAGGVAGAIASLLIALIAAAFRWYLDVEI